MTTFEEYIEELCRKHPAIRHEHDGKCHYTCLADESQTRFAHTMRYPCVVVDSGDFGFEEQQPGNVLMNTAYTVMFLDHVRDTGNSSEVQGAFRRMRSILVDFARKFSRDKRAMCHKFLNRFTLDASEGMRVEMKDAGLYGYALFLNNNEAFTDADCNHIFD